MSDRGPWPHMERKDGVMQVYVSSQQREQLNFLAVMNRRPEQAEKRVGAGS